MAKDEIRKLYDEAEDLTHGVWNLNQKDKQEPSGAPEGELMAAADKAHDIANRLFIEAQGHRSVLKTIQEMEFRCDTHGVLNYTSLTISQDGELLCGRCSVEADEKEIDATIQVK